MFKLGHFVEGEWEAHSHAPTYITVGTASGSERVLSVSPRSDPSTLAALCKVLTSPFFLLYVLHTPRGEGDPGRYQSGAMTHEELQDFLREFGDFLSSDARFDLWVHSPADSATIVWDRHDLIHAYGQPARFVTVLQDLGFHLGEPAIPVPHEHHYHAVYDGQAQALLASRDWTFSRLLEEDEQ